MTKQQAKQQQHQFYSSTLIASIKDNQIFIPAFVTLIILVVTSLVFFFYKRSKAKANTILIIGPSGSGKSAIFGKLVNQKNEWSTVSSVQENIYSDYLCKEGLDKPFILVDYPGAETLRKALFNKWFIEQIDSVCCVIFVVDSATFSKKDVAEYLYDVLYETKNTKIPVLVVCNKQDLAHAKAGQLIEKLIEQEFGLINISREAALSLTEGSGDLSLAEQQKILTNNGQEFKWENLNDGKNKKERPLFVECSAIEQEKENNEFSLDPLRKWIGEKCCYF
uniref:Signal recognition particle receptor subunit beta n=2 Tax=Meloidogyne TaxID=189290 RepID=A0A6V7WST6_MELEN|nr:unnamed protein product [Meloidogyne enterolobii]